MGDFYLIYRIPHLYEYNSKSKNNKKTEILTSYKELSLFLDRDGCLIDLLKDLFHNNCEAYLKFENNLVNPYKAALAVSYEGNRISLAFLLDFMWISLII